MARLALSIVGQVVGSYLGGPIGGAIGSQLGNLAGSAIDQQIFGGGSAKGVKSSDVAVQVSTYGHPINRVWGSMVVAGDLIWVGKRLKKEKQISSKGGFGGTGSSFTVYRQSFMVGVCEASVCDVLRIWADAKLIYDATGKSKVKQRYSSLKIRIQLGGESNTPDELIEAERGIGLVPAFKHLHTIMFENMPLRDFGNRVPNIRVLVATKCAEDETHSVEWIGGFGLPGFFRDSLAPSRTGQPFVVMPGELSTVPRAIFYRVNIQKAKIEYQADTGYRWGGFGPGDTSADEIYYYNSSSYQREGETCAEVTLTHARTAMWPYPTDTFMGITGCTQAFLPPEGSEWMIDGFYRVNQNTPTVEIYHASTGDLNHGRVDVFTPGWHHSFRVTGFGGFFDGPGRIRDLDGDSAGTIYALFTSDGQTTFVNEWDLTDDISDARTLRWVPADGTIVVTSKTKAVKISTVDGSVLTSLDFPFRMAPNFASAHGNFTSSNTLWFVTTEYDASIPHDPSVYAYYPVFLEIDYVTLTIKREIHFIEAAAKYPLPTGDKLFVAANALYFPAENTIVAQDEGREVVGIFKLGTGMQGECPTLKEVVEEICLMTGKLTLDQIDATALANDRVCGFVNDTQRPARELLEMLAGPYFFNGRNRDGKLEFVKRTGSSLLTIPHTDLAAHEEGNTVPVTLKESRQQEIELPRDIQMLYINPDRDYEQDSVQEVRNARVVESTERATINVPIVFTQSEAKHIVSVIAREQWLNRTTYEAMLAPPYQRLDVLDAVTVTLEDNTTRFIRWTEINEGANGLLEMKGVDHHPEIYTDLPLIGGGGSGGGVIPGIPGIVQTELFLMDTPLLKDADDGSILYHAVTPVSDEGRWGGAEILRSLDEEETWDDFSEQSIAATAGHAVTVLAAPDAWTVWDEVNTVDVLLNVGELFNASAIEVLNLANAALLGDELIQFRTATLISSLDRRYRLSGLLRGRRGTEWAIGTHQVSENFVLLNNDGVKRVTLPLSDLAVRRDYRAVTADLTIEDSQLETLTWEARSLKPYAVAHARATRTETDDILLTWVRRSRLNGAGWQSGQDPPLGEASEAYEVDVIWQEEIVRTLETATQSVTYTVAQQAADSIAATDAPAFAIYQISNQVGRGFAATVSMVPGEEVVIPAPDVPDAPTGLTATTVSSTEIDVDCDLTEPHDVTAVRIERSFDNVAWSFLVNVIPFDLPYRDSGLTPATLHYYRSLAFNDAGNSAYSNTDSDTTDTAPIVAPDPPSLLGVEAVSSGRIDGSFTDNSGNETSFEVWRSVNGGTFTLRLLLLPNVTTFSDTGLTASTLYAYKVLAKNSAGSSAFSNTDSATTDPIIIVGPGVFFVSTTGNNLTGKGSITNPFKTWARAFQAVSPGGTVYGRGGTHAEALTNPPSGTSWTNAVRIAAYSGEPVIIQPTSGRPLSLIYQGAQLRYMIFEGLVFDGNNNTSFPVNLDGVNFNSNNICYIRFLNVEVKNGNASGILTGRGADFLEFIGVKSHDNGSSNQDHGLYLESSDCLIEGGEYYNNSGFGVHIYNGFLGQTSSRNIVRKLRIYANGSGLIFGSGDGNTASNVLIYGQTDVAGYALGVGFGATNTRLYHCTVSDNAADGIHIRRSTSGTIGRNNISYSNGTNIFIDSRVIATTTLTNTLTTDPDFVDPLTFDFHLQATSDAIGAGVSMPTVLDDFYNNARPRNGLWDIGAAQFYP